jgi:hypothetical protein
MMNFYLKNLIWLIYLILLIVLSVTKAFSAPLHATPPSWDMKSLHDYPRNHAVVLVSSIKNDFEWGVIMITIDGINEIRVGNTLEEMAQSEWIAYTLPLLWQLPAYDYSVQKLVFAEIRGPQVNPTVLLLPVKKINPSEFLFSNNSPFLKIPDPRSSKIIESNFTTWNNHWMSYMDSYGYGNVFYPFSHKKISANNNENYIWVDDSRWTIDYPEQPNSILVGLIYFRWMFPKEWKNNTGLGDFFDLRDVEISVSLRGKNLDLGGAVVTVWILCNGKRYHFQDKFLDINNYFWTENKIKFNNNQDSWHMSWSRDRKSLYKNLEHMENQYICLDKVESIGFAFRGFESKKVKGIFQMKEFSISK